MVVGLNYEDCREDLGSDDVRTLEFSEEEANEIKELLENNGFSVTALIGKKAKKDNVLKNLVRNFDLFHFTGHGSTEKDRSMICLSDGDLDTGDLDVLEPKDLSGDLPKVSFINACESATENTRGQAAYNWAKALARFGSSALVATLWSIDEEASLKFSKWFYKQFIERGRSIGDAVRRSRIHIKKSNESLYTWPSYVLYGYPHLSLEEVLHSNEE